MADSKCLAPRQLERARLGLFLNLPMHLVDGEYTARYPHLFDFFLALGTRTAGTTLVLPLKHGGPRNPEYGTVQVPPGVRIQGLPYWSSAQMLVRRIHLVAPAALRLGLGELGRLDIVGAVAPSVVGTIVIASARLRNRPVFVLVRGEKQRTVRLMMGERRARPYVAALRAMELPLRRWIAAGVPTFVAGRELVERYSAPAARLYDLYPALSRDFPLAAVPREPGREAGPVRLVTVARLSAEKGIDDLLRAIAVLRDQGTHVTLEIAGEGPMRTELEALTEALRLSDRVQFAGFVPYGPKLIELLDRGEVFVLPSRSEGLPHALVEAMARALPVVATAVGGIPAFLAGDGGVVVPVGDPLALATALAQLNADERRLAQLSRHALETARRVRPEVQLDEFCHRLSDAYPTLSTAPPRCATR